MSDKSKVYTPKEVAVMLGCEVDHVYNLIDEGYLRAINISVGRRKRCFRIYQEDIDAFKAAAVVGNL